MDLLIWSWISFEEGHTSERNTSFPDLSFPRGEFVKSISTVPAIE